MGRDFYAVLAVSRNATPEQIRQRFRELARQRHPDRFTAGDKEAAEHEFQEITEAFNVLTDPERRRRHDMDLQKPELGATAADPRQLVRIYLQRGVKAYRDRNYLEAAANFDRATQADPGNAQAWHHLAQACSHHPNWLARAVAAIERACELEPMNPSYHRQAGRIFALAQQTERAVEHYRKAIEWGGDDPDVREALEQLEKPARRGGLFGRVG
jgi:curved DNA-binding protein CbpA